MSGIWRRLIHLFRRDEAARDLQEEMRLHVELRARQLRERGVAEDEAKYMAQRQFGNRTVVQDRAAEQWGWTSWERLFQDFRLAARTLRKTPGFTAVVVSTLALGLGINTAVFSVVNTVMIRGLPYPQADRLVSLWEENSPQMPSQHTTSGTRVGGAGGANRTTVAAASLADYRAARSLSGLAAYDSAPMNLTGLGTPERLRGEAVTWTFFDVLGVPPAMGRTFLPEDDQPDAAAVVILTYDFWQRHMGGDTAALGHNIMLNARPYRVVGILPRTFESPAQFGIRDPMQFYVPAAYSKQLLASRGDHEVNVVARLQPGVTVAAAQQEFKLISANLARQFPKSNSGMRAVIAPLRDDLVRNVSDSLLALLGASGLIVLITCVNVANLLLVRAVARRHESSVRLALGASRFRMTRQFLAESLVVAAAGCIAGILLGRALMAVLLALAPAGIPQIQNVSLDWRVFAFCAALATVNGLAFGIAPAWQASQTSPVDALRAAGRSTGGKSQARWRNTLTVAEMSLSMILMVGAALLLKSFVLLQHVNLGFQPDRVLAMAINLPPLRYPTAADRVRFFEQLEERVRALPGVSAMAYANRLPLRGGWSGGLIIDGVPGVVEPDMQAVSPGYFETLGIGLRQGRLLTAGDRTGRANVALVNQAFQKQYLQGRDALGTQIARGPDRPWISVVGVVSDVRRGGKTEVIKPEVYLPALETELYPVIVGDVAVRTAGDPRQLVNAIQAQVWALDKDQPVTGVTTLGEIIDTSVSQRRFQTLLLVVFAAVAVGLAAIGIFGVLAYSVSQRERELGLRMALGAAPRSIVGLVLKQAAGVTAAGVVIGLAGAFGLTRYLQSLLFGVERTDWHAYAAAVGLLVIVGITASLIPAGRGARVDPIVALREE